MYHKVYVNLWNRDAGNENLTVSVTENGAWRTAFGLDQLEKFKVADMIGDIKSGLHVHTISAYFFNVVYIGQWNNIQLNVSPPMTAIFTINILTAILSQNFCKQIFANEFFTNKLLVTIHGWYQIDLSERIFRENISKISRGDVWWPWWPKDLLVTNKRLYLIALIRGKNRT